MMTSRGHAPALQNLKGYAGMVADSYQRRQVLQLLMRCGAHQHR